MDKETIERLYFELLQVDTKFLYDYIKINTPLYEMYQSEDGTVDKIALMGFYAGAKFALENIDIPDSENKGKA